MIKKGDILLIRNWIVPLSWIISWFTYSKWTHVAWIYDNKYLLESRSSGIIKTPIKKYLNKRIYKVKLLRLKGIKKEKIKQAIKFAIELKYKRNYFKFLWTLILIAFDYARRRPIMSCSGMIANCLSQVGFYFKKYKNPLLITPADIDNSKRPKNVNYELRKYIKERLKK